MKKILINFADGKYIKPQKYNSLTGKWIAGFDEIIEYSPIDIDNSFMEKNREIFSMKRGCGCWLWKPYLIFETLKKIDNGDYLMYSDAGAFFCKKVDSMIKQMQNSDIWVSDIPLIEKQWTKPAVLKFLDADSFIENSPQIQASFIIIKKSKESLAFVQEWLDLCRKPELILPIENEEKGDCLEHREDQSILSVLCKKKGIVAHRDPCQFARVPEIYKTEGRIYKDTNHANCEPICIVHYRNPNIGKIQLLKLWIMTWIPEFMMRKLSKTQKK